MQDWEIYGYFREWLNIWIIFIPLLLGIPTLLNFIHRDRFSSVRVFILIIYSILGLCFAFISPIYWRTEPNYIVGLVGMSLIISCWSIGQLLPVIGLVRKGALSWGVWTLFLAGLLHDYSNKQLLALDWQDTFRFLALIFFGISLSSLAYSLFDKKPNPNTQLEKPSSRNSIFSLLLFAFSLVQTLDAAFSLLERFIDES